MNSRRLLSTCVVIALCISGGASVGSAPQRDWHTRPDRWREPRNFQTTFDPRYESYLSISHQPIEGDVRPGRILSPNKAYWLSFHGLLRAGFTPQKPILIFNERGYLIRIAPTKDDPDYYLKRIEWINEKLVYIEVWWGRVLGSCYIFDAEKELMIHREMIHDGDLPFQQLKRYRKPG